MELLVKRDGNHLIETEGNAFVESDVPDILKKPRVVLEKEVETIMERDNDDDLLIDNAGDYKEIEQHLSSFNIGTFISKMFGKGPEIIPGLWSGYRSTIIQDPKTKRWYKLKGVSLNPLDPVAINCGDSVYKIRGGQKSVYAKYERAMSNRFNKVLEDNGIEPVIKPKGLWKYPIPLKNMRPVASIFEIKGDTRLDELMLVLDGLSSRKHYISPNLKENKNGGKIADVGIISKDGKNYNKAVGNLYYKIGYIVGRLKNLMDAANQTWSSDYNQTNAHYGNIVVYNGTDKLKVGLVDFDTSCDLREFSQSQLDALKKREFETIRSSVMSNPISFRLMTGLPFNNKIITVNPDSRYKFIEGFDIGYKSREKTYSNEIDLGDLKEIFSLLRSNAIFSFAPTSARRDYSSYFKIFEDNDNYKIKKKIDLDDIVKDHYNYQKFPDMYNLIKNYIDTDIYNNGNKYINNYIKQDY